MAKIGMVALGHPDYIDETTRSLTARAEQLLGELGAEVEVVSAGNYEEGLAAGIRLRRSDLDGVVLFLSSWMECQTAMAAVAELSHLPLLLWGFPMFVENGIEKSTGSYVSFAMFQGSLRRADIPFQPLMAPVDGTARPVIERFICAAAAKTALRRSRLGLVGYTSMSIYPGTFDHLLLRTKVGPEILHFDSQTVLARAEHLGENERRDACEKMLYGAEKAPDIPDQMLWKTAGIYQSLKSICAEENLAGINVKCQYEFSKEYGAVPCVALSALADEGLVAGCEGDIPCTVSELILSKIQTDTVTYGDVINHSGNIVKISSCGMLPFSMGMGERRVTNFMPHDGFSGIQAGFVMRPERVTALRLVEEVGQYRLLCFTGKGQRTALRQGYMPALDIALDGDISALVNAYSGQHFALCYGDHAETLRMFAQLMGMEFTQI